jgi:3-deoxy-D-manno-octulosonate 8-phosphate phosphatase KdsC-like HAD superfamily phosphatase
MQDWMRLDPAGFNRTSKKHVRGVQINVLLSPYDVPVAVRGYYDPALKRFVIEFKYIADEPTEKAIQDNIITLRIGQRSRRLMGIEVNGDAIQARAVGLHMFVAEAVNKAIDQFATGLRTSGRQGSYRLAKDVITQQRDQLFQQLSAK